jgi:hypothetical protein
MKSAPLLAVLGALSALCPLTAAPLKVYLMSGQSNMQGFCAVHTFPQIEEDPVTRPIYQKMVNPDGTPRVHEDVWISTSGCAKDSQPGQLTTGYGGGRGGDRIGPELTFGIYMQEHVKEPILLIKAAWGGKSLARDFRPPSAGVHPLHLKAQEEMRAENKDTSEIDRGYAENHGKYTRLLACLIRDVRKELDAPEMKAVIGVLGFNGELETERYRQIEPKHIPWLRDFRKAMAAPAGMPEFKDSVTAVHTEEFWEPRLEELQGRWKFVKAKNGELKKQCLGKDEQKAAMDEFLKTVYTPEEWKLMETGVSHACYHYLGSAKIMSRIGKAFAEAMIKLESP